MCEPALCRIHRAAASSSRSACGRGRVVLAQSRRRARKDSPDDSCRAARVIGEQVSVPCWLCWRRSARRAAYPHLATGARSSQGVVSTARAPSSSHGWLGPTVPCRLYSEPPAHRAVGIAPNNELPHRVGPDLRDAQSAEIEQREATARGRCVRLRARGMAAMAPLTSCQMLGSK